METACAVVAGIVCGLVGCLPPARALEGALGGGRRMGAGAGLLRILASFSFLSGAIAVAKMVDANAVVTFSVSAVGAFLAFWVVEAARAWRRWGSLR